MLSRLLGKEKLMTQALLVVLVIFLTNLSHSDLFGQTTNNFIIPTGTRIEVVLETTLNSDNNRQGDRFTAKVTKSVHIYGKEVIPKETIVEGRYLEAEYGRKMIKNSQINLSYERFIFPDGVSETIVASQVEFENSKKNQKDYRRKTLDDQPSLKRNRIPIGSGTENIVGKKNLGFSEEITEGIIGRLINIFRKRNKRIQLLSGTPMVIQMDRPLTISFTKSD